MFDGQFETEVRSAAGRADVRDAVADVYRRLQQQIDHRKPICVASGKCCHFDEYGHRLYVTTMEMAAFVHELEILPTPASEVLRRPGLPVVPSGPSEYLRTRRDNAGCPFQIGKLCGVHAIRPFGCRIFFCDPTATQWQQDQYEAFHAELKMLHATLDVPYFYVEWRTALWECWKPQT